MAVRGLASSALGRLRSSKTLAASYSPLFDLRLQIGTSARRYIIAHPGLVHGQACPCSLELKVRRSALQLRQVSRTCTCAVALEKFPVASFPHARRAAPEPVNSQWPCALRETCCEPMCQQHSTSSLTSLPWPVPLRKTLSWVTLIQTYSIPRRNSSSTQQSPQDRRAQLLSSSLITGGTTSLAGKGMHLKQSEATWLATCGLLARPGPRNKLHGRRQLLEHVYPTVISPQM